MQASVIPVSAEGDRRTLQANPSTTRPFEAARTGELAAALGLDLQSFAAGPLWVSTGLEPLLVPLASKEAVSRVSPGATRAGFANASGKVSVYCFSPLAEEKLSVRFFFAKNAGSVTEDPVTGSACANLGGYAVASGQALPLGRTLRQGEAVGRPSVPGLAVDAARAIRVSGEVIELGRRHRALVVVLFALMPDPQD